MELQEIKYKITELLIIVSNYFPELRIGQIMINAANKGGWSQSDIFYCSDKVILDGLSKLLFEREEVLSNEKI